MSTNKRGRPAGAKKGTGVGKMRYARRIWKEQADVIDAWLDGAGALEVAARSAELNCSDAEASKLRSDNKALLETIGQNEARIAELEEQIRVMEAAGPCDLAGSKKDARIAELTARVKQLEREYCSG